MTTYLGFGLGGWEIWVILIIALLLFGHRLPGLARSLGSGIVEFKKGLKDGGEEIKQANEELKNNSKSAQDSAKPN